MTAETSAGKAFDSDEHDQETKKSYYHVFDDTTVEKMRHYFNVQHEDQEAFLRYLKDRKVPTTTPNDV
jgi:hypothetical protein